MNKTDRIVELIKQKIENKKLLEIACGTANFSLSAARYANEIHCIDIDQNRLNEKIKDTENIHFQVMDAAKMNFDNEYFDIVVIYNGLYHIQNQYDEIKKECRRVLKKEGYLFIIGTWKLDITLMIEMYDEKIEKLKDNYIVRIKAEDL